MERTDLRDLPPSYTFTTYLFHFIPYSIQRGYQTQYLSNVSWMLQVLVLVDCLSNVLNDPDQELSLPQYANIE